MNEVQATNQKDQRQSDRKPNMMLIMTGAFIFVSLILSLVFTIYLLTKDKSQKTGEKPSDVTKVSATSIPGPEVIIRKTADNIYELNGGLPIVLKNNDDGINFKNETSDTIGIFIPSLKDEGGIMRNIKILPGATEPMKVAAIRRYLGGVDCISNPRCNRFEILGSMYPALFKGIFTFDLSVSPTATLTRVPSPTRSPISPTTTTAPGVTLTQTPSPTITPTRTPTRTPTNSSTPTPTQIPKPDLIGRLDITKKLDNTYDIDIVISNVGNSISGGFHHHIYIDPIDTPPNINTPDTTSGRTPGLGIATNVDWTYNRNLTPGTHKLYLWIDKANAISESNENNNVIEKTYTVQ